MKILDEPKAIRLKIMDFLARREYSSKEIYQKMSRRVEFREMLDDVIQQLVEDGLISDARFAESYFQSRKNRGFGPLRIKNELKQKGINEGLFNEIQEGTEWSVLALEVLEKKVKGKFPEEKKEVLKLKNFLNYRGFNFQHIDNAFSMIEIE